MARSDLTLAYDNPAKGTQEADAANENTIEACIDIDGVEVCDVAIQTNNVNIDDRGLIYGVDRAHTGLHIVELTGEAAAIVGL